MQCKINSYCYVHQGRNRNKYIVHRISRYSIVMHACATRNKYPLNIDPTKILLLLAVQDHAGRFSFPSSTPLDRLSTPLLGGCARFGLLAIIARSASKLSSSRPIVPPSHFSSSRLGSVRSPPRSMRSGDSTIGGKRARDNFRVGGVLLKFDKDEDEESPEVRESNLVTNDARARRSSSSCCRAYIINTDTGCLSTQVGWMECALAFFSFSSARVSSVAHSSASLHFASSAASRPLHSRSTSSRTARSGAPRLSS